ncbi:MAG: hypothetical protein EPN97_14975 [Alphaproteobacteria bacterium]|nr:MAG: hypothetical protein EPN97_14975 [Alphaproteobacteria bacterium]
MKNIFVVCAFLFAFAAPALAADGKGLAMTKPAEVGDYIQADAPYGQGTLRKLFMKVYETSLWTDAKTWSMKEPFALCIRYNMNFKDKDLVKRTFEEMGRSGLVTQADRETFGPQLTALFHDVHPGDVITAVFLPGRGAVFYYNGKPRGKLEDIAFAKRFFNIWLGPDTSEPDLRDRLLALK